MGNDNSNLKEKLNKIFVDKYTDYLELMRVAGCTEEEVATKASCLIEFDGLTESERARVVKDDMSFLDFFTYNGVVSTDGSGRKLYSGLNKEVAHSVMCTMSSMKANVEFPKEYESELNGPVTLPNIRDMVSSDMSMIFPDMKKMFLLGQKEVFHDRMSKVFRESKELETFSDIIDASVYKNSEAGLYQYMDMVEDAISISKEIDFTKKGRNL